MCFSKPLKQISLITCNNVLLKKVRVLTFSPYVRIYDLRQQLKIVKTNDVKIFLIANFLSRILL